MTQQVVALLQLFKAAAARRDRAGVNSASEALMAADAPLGKQWQSVAALLQFNGEHGAALNAIDLWQRQDGANPAIAFQRAALLARAGRPAEARNILDRLPDTVPDATGNAYLKGTVSINLGETGRALAELRRGIALDPRSGQCWLALAMAGPIDQADADAMRAADRSIFAAMPDEQEKAAFLYAIGKLEDQQGNHEAAFSAFARGAAIMARLRPFDGAEDDRQTEDTLASWSRAAIDRYSAQVTAVDPRPIFVTGLPRSGTTLVEQILASHSAVAGGEELSLFRLVGQDLGGLSCGAVDRFLADGGNLQQLRDLYHHLLDERFPQRGRVVDKTLGASRSLGVVASLFPDAPIIWLRRDPIDCAWSAFRTFFVRSVDWSWSQVAIADYFRNEDRLFDHWTQALGDRILVVPYSDLVSDPASWIERITRHAGLEPEQPQFSPHLSSRAVTTASATQVREPINRKGIGSAAPYVKHLAPFLEHYAPREPVSPS